MKRGADGDMGAPHKRSRRGDEEVRLLIPSKVAGSIIGKGGQNISKLRSQYKASITVPDCPGPERMLTLSSDLDTVCNIIRDVVPNLEENGCRSGRNELDMRFMVHQSQAGCVIGKAGYKIKELREKFGAKVKIFPGLAPQSTDRVCQIVGEPAKCVDTLREIILLIKASPIKGMSNPYDPHNSDNFYCDEYGGWGNMQGGDRRGGIGGGGGGGPGGRGMGGPRGSAGSGGAGPRNGFRSAPPRFGGSTGGGRGPPPRSSNGSGFDRSPVGGGGMGGSRFGGRSLNGGGPIHSPFEKNWSSSNSMMDSPMGGGGSFGGGNSMMGGGDPKSNTTQVTIPRDLAGAIIGKGGNRIRKVRQDSGAGITIHEPIPGTNDRIITITGSSNQIQMAQYLLQQSVHNSTDRNF